MNRNSGVGGGGGGKNAGWKISENLISEGGTSIPDSRVDHSLTNLGFNELPHLTNQNLSPCFVRKIIVKIQI